METTFFSKDISRNAKSFEARQTQADNLRWRQLYYHCKFIHDRAAGLDGTIILGKGVDKPENDNKSSFLTHKFSVGDYQGMAKTAMQYASQPHTNLWVGWHVMRPDLPDYSRGTKDDIIGVLALTVDYDLDTGKAGRLPCDPTIDIITSQKPALNRQPVYVFNQILPPEEANFIAKRLQAYTKSDWGTGDICHLWRLAGTLNWPNRKKLERGRPNEPQEVKFSDAGTNELIDPVRLTEQLEQGLGKKQECLEISNNHNNSNRTFANGHNNKDTQSLFDSLPPTLRKTIQDPPATMDRSRDCNSMYWQLFFRGYSPNQVCTILRLHPDGIAQKYIIEQGGDALEKDVYRAFEKFKNKSRNTTAKTDETGSGSFGSASHGHNSEKNHSENDEPPEPVALPESLPKVESFDLGLMPDE